MSSCLIAFDLSLKKVFIFDFWRKKVAHCVVPEAEAILDKEFPVLDKGFVRLVDYFGGDQRIVQSARVSYGEGTKTVSQDGALIIFCVISILLLLNRLL